MAELPEFDDRFIRVYDPYKRGKPVFRRDDGLDCFPVKTLSDKNI